jgi:hypothetical protein
MTKLLKLAMLTALPLLTATVGRVGLARFRPKPVGIGGRPSRMLTGKLTE